MSAAGTQRQGSFKSLGGAYALMVLFKRLLEKHLRQSVQVPQLLSSTARDFARSLTVCCATDGNHGKSVAAGARLLGCRSVIFIHAGVSQARAEAIRRGRTADLLETLRLY